MSAAESEILEGTTPVADRRNVAVRPIHGIVTAKLIGFTDDGRTPLVLRAGESAALAAVTIVDVHGAHIGRDVILQFADGDPQRPVLMGVVRNKEGWPLEERPAQVEVDVDGKRMLVSAKEQLVLKCGKASVTLTRAGKILIQGTYVSNRSSGVMRIKGGSVQLN